VSSRESLKNVVKIYSRTSYGSNLAFCGIGYKPGDLTELMQGGRKDEVDIFLDRGHKDSGIVGIERGVDNGGPHTELLKMPLLGCLANNMV
jgi:hypothetical protein